MERKEARVKLRIMTGREDAAGASTGAGKNTGSGSWGRKGVISFRWSGPLSGAGKGLQVWFWRSRVPSDGDTGLEV